MGMYTELHFNAELKKDTPEEVIETLRKMVNGAAIENPPDHELFQTSRWSFMLCCDSYYFSSDTHSTLRFDEISKSWFLCIRSNLKNYGGEIEKFIDWIHPYLDELEGEHLGHMRYEEDMLPSLILMGKVIKITEGMAKAAPVLWEQGGEWYGRK